VSCDFYERFPLAPCFLVAAPPPFASAASSPIRWPYIGFRPRPPCPLEDLGLLTCSQLGCLLPASLLASSPLFSPQHRHLTATPSVGFLPPPPPHPAPRCTFSLNSGPVALTPTSHRRTASLTPRDAFQPFHRQRSGSLCCQHRQNSLISNLPTYQLFVYLYLCSPLTPDGTPAAVIPETFIQLLFSQQLFFWWGPPGSLYLLGWLRRICTLDLRPTLAARGRTR